MLLLSYMCVISVYHAIVGNHPYRARGRRPALERVKLILEGKHAWNSCRDIGKHGIKHTFRRDIPKVASIL